MVMKLDFMKKGFIIIAYLAYCTTTILKNQLKLDMGNYEFIICAIIGICLKLSQNTEVIEKLINEIPLADLEMIKAKLESIQESSVSQRSIIEMPNEPYEESETDGVITHRDYKMLNGQIIRIKL
jgi:hypothetical protein